MKLESLVIVNQHVTVNTFSGLVHTARQTMRVGNTQSRWLKEQSRELSKVGPMIGVKSQQGIPTRTWGWITSFLRRKMYGKDVYITRWLVSCSVLRDHLGGNSRNGVL